MNSYLSDVVTLCAMPSALCVYLREAEVYRTAFEKEKELTDRALELAEVGKPKSNWELWGIWGIPTALTQAKSQ